MSHASDALAIARARRQLTHWYLWTTALVLAMLGVGLYVTIRHQFRAELDASLVRATQEVIRAARIRELESTATGAVVDALDELRIPDRSLYLLDAGGIPIKPAHAEPWVIAASGGALDGVGTYLTEEVADDRTLRIRVEGFTLGGEVRRVAIVVADEIELEEQYASLITAFGIAALGALLLVGLAARFLVDRSMRPVEAGMVRQREFMADAAHELRTPVAVLRTRVEVALLKPREAAEYRDALVGVAAEADRLGALVSDLLLLAHADAGERPVEMTPCHLDDIAIEACEAARSLATMAGVGLEVTEFDQADIVADPALIRQSVMILLDNAIKFTQAGGAVAVAVGTRNGEAVLSISDTGPGIPANERERIFDRFVRGSNARLAEPKAGSGLGLAIAQWIATSHGGRIELHDNAPTGTQATLILPIATMPDERA